MKDSLKVDPSRTTMLRRQFIVEMNKRFGAVKKDVKELIVDLDAFGLKESKPMTFMVEKQAYRFMTDDRKIEEFNKWLQVRIDQKVLSVNHEGSPWTAKYVESAYRQGMMRAYTDTRKEALAESLDFYKGSKEEFLRSAFNQPETLAKVRFLGTRSFEELKGVTSAMAQQMNRVLANGIAQGQGPEKISRAMANTISGINRTRARVIARTETIAAHAEGQLDAFEDLGVKELGIIVEWSTAGDSKVCSKCAPLEGTTMSVKEARGLIPKHPNCRCTWIPAKKKKKEQIKEEEKIKVKEEIEKMKREIAKMKGEDVPEFIGKFGGEKEEEAIVRGNNLIDEWRVSKLGDIDQEKALSKWTGSGYDAIQAYQQGLYIPPEGDMDALNELTTTLKDLLKATKTLPQYEGTVWRGLSRMNDVELDKFIKMKVGDVEVLETITSSSIRKRIGKDFGGQVLYEIENAKGAYIGKLSNSPNEAEVLLNKGSKYRVISKETKNMGTEEYPESVIHIKLTPISEFGEHLTSITSAKEYVKEFTRQVDEQIKNHPLMEKIRKMREEEPWKIRKNKMVGEKYMDAFEKLGKEDPITKQLRKEFDEVRTELSAFDKLLKKNEKKLANIQKNTIFELLKEPENISDLLKTKDLAGCDKVAEVILSWVPKKALSDVEMRRLKEFTVTLKKRAKDTAKGEYTFAEGNSLLDLYVKDPKKIKRTVEEMNDFAHEFGHNLSWSINGFMQKQNKFFLTRTKGEAIRELPGYTSVGKKDKFKVLDAYAGRVYEKDGAFPEVSAVGMEYLYKDPMRVLKKDTEWFEMLIKGIKKLSD